jgi:GNAT superfamily N-acetyltransferase
MPISVRPIRADDEDAFVELGRANVLETLPHLSYEEDVVRFYFNYALEQDSVNIFVTQNSEGILTGFLVANLDPYLFRRGFVATQEIVYVLPEYRNTRSGLMLLKNYVTWAKARGVDESFVGVANGIDAERKLKFFERQGFERVGYFLRKIKSNEKDTPSKL